MVDKQMKTAELHYKIIQCLITGENSELAEL